MIIQVILSLSLFVAASDASRTREIDAVFSNWDKPDSPGCALAVISDGRITYRRGYGMANLEESVPITPTTVFNIASVSKQFTAAALHLLAKDGKISLDKDVREYLPELPDFGQKITPRHFLHHTSGLRENHALLRLAGWRAEDVILRQDPLRLIYAQRELNFKPGDEHLYCNSGYMLMGELIRRQSGKSLREFTQNRIFGPLGMTSTVFRDDYRMLIPRRAVSYAKQIGGGFQNVFHAAEMPGQGNLHTTVEDIARWDQAFYDGRVLGRDVIDAMLVRGKLNSGVEIPYASGLSHGTYRGEKTVEHTGSIAGYRSVLLRFPRLHTTIVILSNLATMQPATLARRVADVQLGSQLKEAVAVEAATTTARPTKMSTKSNLALNDYAGDYKSIELGVIYELNVKQEKLFLRHSKGDDVLKPANAGGFEWSGLGETATIRFELGPQASVKTMLVSLPRARNIRFTRVEVRPKTD